MYKFFYMISFYARARARACVCFKTKLLLLRNNEIVARRRTVLARAVFVLSSKKITDGHT